MARRWIIRVGVRRLRDMIGAPRQLLLLRKVTSALRSSRSHHCDVVAPPGPSFEVAVQRAPVPPPLRTSGSRWSAKWK